MKLAISYVALALSLATAHLAFAAPLQVLNDDGAQARDDLAGRDDAASLASREQQNDDLQSRAPFTSPLNVRAAAPPRANGPFSVSIARPYAHNSAHDPPHKPRVGGLRARSHSHSEHEHEHEHIGGSLHTAGTGHHSGGHHSSAHSAGEYHTSSAGDHTSSLHSSGHHSSGLHGSGGLQTRSHSHSEHEHEHEHGHGHGLAGSLHTAGSEYHSGGHHSNAHSTGEYHTSSAGDHTSGLHSGGHHSSGLHGSGGLQARSHSHSEHEHEHGHGLSGSLHTAGSENHSGGHHSSAHSAGSEYHTSSAGGYSGGHHNSELHHGGGSAYTARSSISTIPGGRTGSGPEAFRAHAAKLHLSGVHHSTQHASGDEHLSNKHSINSARPSQRPIGGARLAKRLPPHVGFPHPGGPHSSGSSGHTLGTTLHLGGHHHHSQQRFQQKSVAERRSFQEGDVEERDTDEQDMEERDMEERDVSYEEPQARGSLTNLMSFVGKNAGSGVSGAVFEKIGSVLTGYPNQNPPPHHNQHQQPPHRQRSLGEADEVLARADLVSRAARSDDDANLDSRDMVGEEYGEYARSVLGDATKAVIKETGKEAAGQGMQQMWKQGTAAILRKFYVSHARRDEDSSLLERNGVPLVIAARDDEPVNSRAGIPVVISTRDDEAVSSRATVPLDVGARDENGAGDDGAYESRDINNEADWERLSGRDIPFYLSERGGIPVMISARDDSPLDERGALPILISGRQTNLLSERASVPIAISERDEVAMRESRAGALSSAINGRDLDDDLLVGRSDGGELSSREIPNLVSGRDLIHEDGPVQPEARHFHINWHKVGRVASTGAHFIFKRADSPELTERGALLVVARRNGIPVVITSRDGASGLVSAREESTSDLSARDEENGPWIARHEDEVSEQQARGIIRTAFKLLLKRAEEEGLSERDSQEVLDRAVAEGESNEQHARGLFHILHEAAHEVESHLR